MNMYMYCVNSIRNNYSEYFKYFYNYKDSCIGFWYNRVVGCSSCGIHVLSSSNLVKTRISFVSLIRLRANVRKHVFSPFIRIFLSLPTRYVWGGYFLYHVLVAQSVELVAVNHCVVGSSPT
ncbi:hypothetical protein [Bacillus phage Maceta]|nr:hypothetical protein [Bacillus phage Maceta]